MNALAYLSLVGNCDVDFFVFRYCFQIMSPKFPKIERVQNSVVKFWIVRKRKREITKVSKTEWNYHSYMIMILHRLSIYTFMKYSLLQTSNKRTCTSLFRHPVLRWNKSICASLLIKTLSIHNPSLLCLVHLFSAVNNF
jgi:hypothetical protein